MRQEQDNLEKQHPVASESRAVPYARPWVISALHSTYVDDCAAKMTRLATDSGSLATLKDGLNEEDSRVDHATTPNRSVHR